MIVAHGFQRHHTPQRVQAGCLLTHHVDEVTDRAEPALATVASSGNASSTQTPRVEIDCLSLHVQRWHTGFWPAAELGVIRSDVVCAIWFRDGRKLMRHMQRHEV
jgi:hypothetical protein